MVNIYPHYWGSSFPKLILEGPLLGRGARIKRAKSAKSTKTDSPPSDERLLLQEDSSSTHSEDIGVLNPNFHPENRVFSGTRRPLAAGAKVEPKARARPKTARANRYVLRII